MDPINVTVNVKIDFSESAKAFIQSLFSGQVAKPISEVQKPIAETKKASETKKPVVATTTKPDVTATPKMTEANASSNLTIDDVRNALSLKVNAHRAEIKDKLNELGAPSVTKLDQSKYEEMYNFLTAL